MKFKTIREATESWVREMDFISVGLIKDAVAGKEYVWNELTPLTVGQEVYCDCGVNLKGEFYDGYGEVVKISDKQIVVRLEDTDENVLAEKDDVCSEGRGCFPAWNMMFQPRERIDEEWISDNLQKVADCGFRIYEHDDYGVFLGIDGGGYDFYTEHWIPLYKARGLQWHDSPDKKADGADKNEMYQNITQHIFEAYSLAGDSWIILATNEKEAQEKAEAAIGSSRVEIRKLESTGDPQVYRV